MTKIVFDLELRDRVSKKLDAIKKKLESMKAVSPLAPVERIRAIETEVAKMEKTETGYRLRRTRIREEAGRTYITESIAEMKNNAKVVERTYKTIDSASRRWRRFMDNITKSLIKVNKALFPFIMSNLGMFFELRVVTNLVQDAINQILSLFTGWESNVEKIAIAHAILGKTFPTDELMGYIEASMEVSASYEMIRWEIMKLVAEHKDKLIEGFMAVANAVKAIPAESILDVFKGLRDGLVAVGNLIKEVPTFLRKLNTELKSLAPAFEPLASIFDLLSNIPVLGPIFGELSNTLRGMYGGLRGTIAGFVKLAAVGAALAPVFMMIMTFSNSLSLVFSSLSIVVRGVVFANSLLTKVLVTLGCEQFKTITVVQYLAGILKNQFVMAIRSVWMALNFLAAHPILLIIIAIIAAIIILINYFRKWGDVVNWLRGVWDVAFSAIKTIWDAVVGGIISMARKVEGIIKRTVDVIKMFVTPWIWIYDKLVGHSIIPDLVSESLGWFTKLEEGITSTFDKIGSLEINVTTSADMSAIEESIATPRRMSVVIDVSVEMSEEIAESITNQILSKLAYGV